MSEVLPLPASLHLARYRLRLTPDAPMVIREGLGGVLRGGLGLALKQGACIRPFKELCQACMAPTICPYAFLFEAKRPEDAEVLKAQADIPQPFVISLDKPTVTEWYGDIIFDLLLMGKAIRYFPYFLAAFRLLGERGIGSERTPCLLSEATYLDASGEATQLYDGVGRQVVVSQPRPDVVTGWVSDLYQQVAPLTLTFLTPTRLKFDERIVRQAPPFHVVIRTLLRRLSSLSYFHGGQRWDIDYRGWIERAQTVETTAADVQWVDWERYSTRQQQRMNLGGIVGRVTYAGDLGPFLPLLRVGELIHVGKNVVFGHGQYRLAVEPSSQV